MGKITEIRELYNDTINDITKSEDKWLEFLKTASWNFKYDFNDQVLIYAQRPDATACAEMEEWNKKVRRWVNKGANYIFVFSNNENSKYPFRFVFDVSDTHNYRNTPYKLWNVKQEYEKNIIESLEAKFGDIGTNSDLTQAIFITTNNMVVDNIQDYMSSITKYKKYTMLENLSEEEIGSLVYQTVFSSVAYMMLTRCGIEAEQYINKSEFSYINQFNNYDLTILLGTAISDMAEIGLREISKTVINLQKEEKIQNRTFVNNQKEEYPNNEINIKGGIEDDKTRIHESGRLQYAQPNNETRRNTNREIRTDEVTLFKGEQERRIYNITNEQQVSTTFKGNTGTSNENDKTNSRENGESIWNNRRIESTRPNEMDRTNEQLQIDSRGKSNDRTNLQLEENNTNILTENEQKQIIAEAENASVFSFTQEMIDSVLQEGSHFESGKFRIYEQFSKSLSSKENADFLKNEYGIGGRSADSNGVTEEHNAKGITLSFEDENNHQKLRLTWQQIEKRIRELISIDRYLNQIEKDEYYDWLDANDKTQINNEIHNKINDEEYELATRLHNFIKDYDLYSYMDNVPIKNTEEQNIELIRADIDDELNIKEYIDFLKGTIEDVDYDDELAVEAKNLIAKLEERLPYYEYSVGDIVYIGTKECSITAIDNERVSLRDTKFPILVVELERKVFDKRVQENSANDKLRNEKIIQKIKGKEEKYSKLDKENVQENKTKNTESIEPVKEQETKFKASIKRKHSNKIEYFDLHPEIPLKDRYNYAIANKAIGEGTKKEKYKRNIDAIKVLKQCEDENRYATQEEQEILAQYVGWGGIAEAFDNHNDEWSKEYKELYSILTEKEYNEAKQSTLTSFYTPPIVIEAIYKALKKMGLRQGNILEPSCRSG